MKQFQVRINAYMTYPYGVCLRLDINGMHDTVLRVPRKQKLNHADLLRFTLRADPEWAAFGIVEEINRHFYNGDFDVSPTTLHRVINGVWGWHREAQENQDHYRSFNGRSRIHIWLEQQPEVDE